MNFDVESHTILKVIHGSNAYGTAMPDSDIDYKGVCCVPIAHQLGFLHHFEQYETYVNKGADYDCAIYGLKKFFQLAIDCNPNIIEVLWGDKWNIVTCTPEGEELLASKELFLSTKARHTFAGYAHAQLKRIRTHRSWLFNPPKGKPERKDYGLPEVCKITDNELGAFDAAEKKGIQIESSSDLIQIILKERQYRTDMNYYKQYENWKLTRNPERAALEAKFGFDCKHSYHLVRLMRMCKEILAEHKVIVLRPDYQDLMDIRTGLWPYERVIEEAESLDAECEELYRTTPLQKSPDRIKLNDLCVKLTVDFEKRVYDLKT